MPPVKRASRSKIIPRARLEAEARHAACSCSRNYVTQHRASRSPSARGLNRVHGLDLTVIGREALQCADALERFIVPYRPEADVGGLQPGEVQRMRAARRCFRAGTGHMEMQEIDYPRVAEVALDNPYHFGSANTM